MLIHGYVKNDEDRAEIMEIFNAQVQKIKFEKLNFTEKLWYFKAHVWKNQLLQEYKYTLKYAFHMGGFIS
ncbi:hypothetical protein [Chryseobacterium wanjuense]